MNKLQITFELTGAILFILGLAGLLQPSRSSFVTTEDKINGWTLSIGVLLMIEGIWL